MDTFRASRRRFACTLAALLPLELLAARIGVARAAPVLLVTAEEARRCAAPDTAIDRMLPKFPPEAPAGPRIDLLQPVLDMQLRLKSPFAIEVRFVPMPDAPIDPGSFRVLYGNLRLDITSRILDKVKVAATGFSLAEAAIPAGRHRMLLRVDDLKQRTGELDLRFEVE